MSVNSLCPQNTQNARSVGVNAFKRFLEMENVPLDYVFDCMARNPNGKCMGAVMDMFALHLAFTTGVKEKMLATSTVMSYFRHVKNWLLEHPECHVAIEERLLEMARILEQHMIKREPGGATKHAPACTKKDLSVLVRYLYAHAASPTDYQDAALMTVLWYVFGRASDFSFVQKESLSVCSGKNLFVRLVRVKTADQQGLTLYPDEDITTCPILAIAVTLAMQTAPCPQLLENVRPTPIKLDLEALETLPLMKLLMQAEQPQVVPSSTTKKPKARTRATTKKADTKRTATTETPEKNEKTATKQPKKTAAPPGIHNQINRLLGRVAKPAGILASLSSHSFRRGGAQHANGEAGMSMQWISDRGGWNLSTSQKIWSYVFNTTQEDQRVSKVLSGWKSTAQVPLDTLGALDAQALESVRAFQSLLFNTCTGLQDRRLNLCPEVLDACTSRLLRALPLLRAHYPEAPIIARVDNCAAAVGLRRYEVLCVSMVLEEAYKQEQQERDVDAAREEREPTAADHQTALIRELLDVNRLLVNRLEALEAMTGNPAAPPKTEETSGERVSDPASMPRKKTPAAHLSAVWFEWYAGEPRLWSETTDRKKRSEARHVVAFMKLFLPRGMLLEPSAATFRDDVMRLGTEAELAIVAFLGESGIKSRGSSAVLKHMRALHKHGKLNGYIREYKGRLAIGALLDPAPRDGLDVLHVVEV